MQTSERRGDGYVNLALLTDGLRAEREQGITIDVAYRYFQTPRRKFMIADTPGHEQYTRNMVTGASTADLSVVLVDARKGVSEQTRRHAYIASLLRIPHVVVCVNKMDLVDYDEAVFEHIVDDLTDWAARLDIPDVSFIPISALHGDNVVDRSTTMPWYDGPPLLYHLEHVVIAPDRNLAQVRFPVQWVIRPNERRAPRLPRLRRHGRRRRARSPATRCSSCRAASAPRSRRSTRYDGPVETAFPTMSVTVRVDRRPRHLARRHDRRGRRPAASARELDAMVCWMGETPLRPGARAT